MAMNFKLVSLALVSAVLLGAGVASAVEVAYQQRFFEKFGDGSASVDSVPCCAVTLMNPVATIEPRTIMWNNTWMRVGPYFAEYKNKTAMVGNLFGFGTLPKLNGKGQWGRANYNATGGVTIPKSKYNGLAAVPKHNYESHASLMLAFPGGNLRRLSTMIDRTVNDLVFKPNQGPGNYTYTAANFPALNRPAFRANLPICVPQNPPNPAISKFPACWEKYPQQAGILQVIAGPNQFGGTRAIIHEQFTIGVDNGSVPNRANRFKFPVANGPGHPVLTAMGAAVPNVLRETRSATYAQVTIPSTMATSGMQVFQGIGTGWFTMLPYTTGTVKVFASTIGNMDLDFSRRTDMGTNMLNVTGMGGVTGVLQLVSGHLLQSRGGINTNLAGTNMTKITFTPEPASAALLGAGALGLIGLVVRDRRNRRI